MKEVRNRDARMLLAMGFEADGSGGAKASAGGAEMRLDKVGGEWRCSCSAPSMRGGCVSRVASWRAASPLDAALLCAALAKEVFSRRRAAHETEAERLRAMEGALDAMLGKAEERP